MTQEFLSCFPGNHIFVSIDEKSEDRTPWHHNSIDKLEIVNKRGRGVFFTVNNLNQKKDPDKKRTKKMFVNARAVWVEDDVIREKPREDFPLAPNIIVNSSPGKYHYYWLTFTEDLHEWESVMETFVQDYGCDERARDCCRVLRLPGYKHLKKDTYENGHIVTCAIYSNEPYSWLKILEKFPPTETYRQKETISPEDVKGVDHWREQYTEGHRHGPSRSVAMKLANGYLHRADAAEIGTAVFPDDPKSAVRLACDLMGKPVDSKIATQILQAVFPEDNLNHHAQSVSSAYSKVVEEVVTLPEKEERQDEIEWPPGLLGQLAQDFYRQAPYQYKKVAIMMAFAATSGLAARVYRAAGLGPNLYAILLMDTGMGKDQIRVGIKNFLSIVAKDFDTTIYGAERFTGPKPLYRMLSQGMSRVCVCTEAGYVFKSKSGDQANFTGTLLSAFTACKTGGFLGNHAYSSAEDTLPQLDEPALSIIFESTPRIFSEYIEESGSEDDGFLGRSWVLRINDNKPYPNRYRVNRFDDQVLARYKELAHMCLENNSDVVHHDQQIHLTIGDEIWQMSNRFVDIQNQARRSGQLKLASAASRAWEKALRFAALIDIADGKTEVSLESFQWAIKNCIEPEMHGCESAFVDSSKDILDIVLYTVAPIIQKMITGVYRDARCSPNKLCQKDGVFTKDHLYRACKNNKAVKELSYKGAKAQSGVDVIINYMVEHQLLFDITEHSKIIKLFPHKKPRTAYQVTEKLQDLMQDD